MSLDRLLLLLYVDHINHLLKRGMGLLVVVEILLSRGNEWEWGCLQFYGLEGDGLLVASLALVIVACLGELAQVTFNLGRIFVVH